MPVTEIRNLKEIEEREQEIILGLRKGQRVLSGAQEQKDLWTLKQGLGDILSKAIERTIYLGTKSSGKYIECMMPGLVRCRELNIWRNVHVIHHILE